MKRQTGFLIGSAEVDYTPKPGLSLVGQMHERKALYKRDPLMANAVAFRLGSETVVIVSVDVCVLQTSFVQKTQRDFEKRTGIPARKLILHATHTHVAPGVESLIADIPDPSFGSLLAEAIMEAAEKALALLRPARIFGDSGLLAHIGWNRRAMFQNGSSRMYGNCTMDGFAGLEGPRDPVLSVLCIRDLRDRITTVLINKSTHPNTLESGTFYSADIPGEVRKVLKRLLGESVVVVYLTGASGNTAPSLLDTPVARQPWRGDLRGRGQGGCYPSGTKAAQWRHRLAGWDGRQHSDRRQLLCGDRAGHPHPGRVHARLPAPSQARPLD